jgi:hypothetical protein
MLNKNLILLCFIASIMLSFRVANAQEIEATVDIVTENLQYEHAMHIEAFKFTIENYINSNKFSDVE